jgi:hypothetical protein
MHFTALLLQRFRPDNLSLLSILISHALKLRFLVLT